MPLKLDNLETFDLSADENMLLAKKIHSSFYTGVLRNASLPTDAPIHAFGSDKQYGIPDLPGIYAVNPNSEPGLHQVYYGSREELPEDQVKVDIIAAVKRVHQARCTSTKKEPEFVMFANHTPFNMMVSNHAIQGGFYHKLHKLPGQMHTFYNGASVHTQDSSVLWRFTEGLLPKCLPNCDGLLQHPSVGP